MQALSEASKGSVGVMLERLSTLWHTRAVINSGMPNYDELAFAPEKKDFSESLLPFRSHGAWLEAPNELKSICLSYAWVIYNLKTIYIECDIVTPACEDIIKTPPLVSRNRIILQDVMSQALLDEALHTRMSLSACHYIYRMRGIPYLDFSDFNLVQWRNVALSQCTAEWERRLTRFGIACASETLITDYLKTMAEDSSIQDICHQVTRTHAAEEWGHSSVFSFAASDIVHGLTHSERDYFRGIIIKTVQLFANNELGAWESAFSLVNFPCYRDILYDTGNDNEIGVYTDSVEMLINRIGLGEEQHIRAFMSTASAAPHQPEPLS